MKSKKPVSTKKRSRRNRQSSLEKDYRSLFLNGTREFPVYIQRVSQEPLRTFTTYGAYEDPI